MDAPQASKRVSLYITPWVWQFWNALQVLWQCSIKRWHLCPLLQNLGCLKTARTNRIWLKCCCGSCKVQTEKDMTLPPDHPGGKPDPWGQHAETTRLGKPDGGIQLTARPRAQPRAGVHCRHLSATTWGPSTPTTQSWVSPLQSPDPQIMSKIKQ